MGLLDRSREPKPSVSLPQLCYDVAYFLLPRYAFERVGKVVDLRANTPHAAGPFFYVMACRMRGIEPVIDDARRLRWHHGALGEGCEYYVLEYPSPPPVDILTRPPEEITTSSTPFVLAPYFSAIVRAIPEGTVRYFVLGQSPMGGVTTLRGVLPEGINCNLGRGPEPRLDAFLDVVAARASSDT